MHASCLVVLPAAAGDMIEEAVRAVMEPYNEENHRCGWWDWYQIGGRWTGSLDGYDPETDPEKQETCDLCSGTGKRPGALEEFGAEWYASVNGCNGCHGKGMRTMWPTQWPQRDGDCQPVEKVPVDFIPHSMIDSDGYASHRTVWSGHAILEDEKWEEHFRKALSHEAGNLAVIVDYHS